ncbi:MAG: response regulator [Verrucomicrobia bacterium]|nr:response regulator [Verrucomicrobiota bacterium]
MKKQDEVSLDRAQGGFAPVRLLLITAVSILLGETAIMVLLPSLQLSRQAGQLLDGVVLTGLTFPVVYFCLFRPMSLSLAARRQAEASLQKAHGELERRVEERTAALAEANVVLEREVKERKDAEQALQQRVLLAALAADVGAALGRKGPLREALQRCAEAMVSHLGVAFARIWTFNPARRCLELQASAGLYTHLDGPHSRVPLGSLKIGWIAQERKPLLTNVVLGDPRVNDQDWAKREGMVAFAGYPLVVEDRLAGVVAMFSRQTIDPMVFESLAAVADQLAQGIELKQAEDRVRAQANLLDLARDAIVVRDLEDRIEFWNQGAERLYGWTVEEALGNEVTSLLVKDPAAFRAAKQQVVASGAWSGELRQFAKDRREVIVNSRWTLLRDDQGRPHSVLVINTDITEKKKIEAQFLRTQRLESIGQLAGGIAHDLNNILAPVMMVAPLLREQLTHPESRSLLDTLEASAKRGADIVRQILTFSRGVSTDKVPVQSRHVFKEITNLIRETFPRALTVQTLVPADLWLVEGDVTQLHQVLMNLCVNARDAMPQGGLLTLAAENVRLDDASARRIPNAKFGPYVLWRVADTGTGIPPEIIDRIFDPFFTTKEVGKGTGLGLSTVLGIVRGHSGCLQVESQPGQGTQFSLYLPALEAPEPNPIKRPAPPPPGRGELILVVDDEESVRTATGKLLEKHGYRVLSAAGGTQAVELFQQHQAEMGAVLTDLMMPQMDGVALVRVLRRLEPRVKVLATSGLAVDPLLSAVREAGVSVFLRKPCDAFTLLEKVRTVLDAGPSTVA